MRCGSKNRHQKEMFEKIGLCAQNILTTRSSRVNIIGGPI